MAEESNLECLRPKRFSERELSRVGIRIVDKNQVWLRCVHCGEMFLARRDADGHLPQGYWKCPNGCNEFADVAA